MRQQPLKLHSASAFHVGLMSLALVSLITLSSCSIVNRAGNEEYSSEQATEESVAANESAPETDDVPSSAAQLTSDFMTGQPNVQKKSVDQILAGGVDSETEIHLAERSGDDYETIASVPAEVETPPAAVLLNDPPPFSTARITSNLVGAYADVYQLPEPESRMFKRSVVKVLTIGQFKLEGSDALSFGRYSELTHLGDAVAKRANEAAEFFQSVELAALRAKEAKIAQAEAEAKQLEEEKLAAAKAEELRIEQANAEALKKAEADAEVARLAQVKAEELKIAETKAEEARATEAQALADAAAEEKKSAEEILAQTQAQLQIDALEVASDPQDAEVNEAVKESKPKIAQIVPKKITAATQKPKAVAAVVQVKEESQLSSSKLISLGSAVPHLPTKVTLPAQRIQEVRSVQKPVQQPVARNVPVTASPPNEAAQNRQPASVTAVAAEPAIDLKLVYALAGIATLGALGLWYRRKKS